MNNNVKLQLTRVIKAKRSQVFDAWTKPELMTQWYAPGSMTTPSASSDLRVGGKYHVEMKGEMNNETVNPTVTGTYQKIVANELLCFTWGWEGDPSPVTLVTVEFKDVTEGTEITLTHEKFVSDELRDKHQHGWIGCVENLVALFKR